MKARTLAVVRSVTEHPYEEDKSLRPWSQPTDLSNGEHPAGRSFEGGSGLRKAYLCEPRKGWWRVPGADIRFGVLRLGDGRADLDPCGGGEDAVGAFCGEARRTRGALAVYETGSQAVPRGANPIRAISELAL
jgi:hypothetical protein